MQYCNCANAHKPGCPNDKPGGLPPLRIEDDQPSSAGGQKASRRFDGKPETDADKRFFDLRESGYTGPVDQDGNATNEHADIFDALRAAS